jgi:ribose transport system ATP-binding protein
MDEPSASLTERELANLFRLIRRLRAEAVAIIYISHRLEEIDEIGDRVTVLRDGRVAAAFASAAVDHETLVRHMVGRSIPTQATPVARSAGEEIFRAEGLRRAQAVRDVSFDVRRGEVYCLAGLVGSGRTEVARLIFGADRRDAGRLMLHGAEVAPRTPREAIDLGIGLLTEDRNEQGLIMELSVRDNILLSGFGSLRRLFGIDWKRAQALSQGFVESLRIRTQGVDERVAHLSGGNRQKVVLARWLFAKARLLIFDEPTKGIDVAVKSEIHALLRDLAERGTGVVVISSDLTEVLRLGDRIGVMRDGRMCGILTRGEATAESVMRLATGAVQRSGSCR